MSSQVVVVSGGAGGIGAATVQRFARAGFIPFVLDRDVPSFKAAHAVCDLITDDLDAVLADAAGHGQIAHVVSIAGGAMPQSDDHRSEADLQAAGKLPDPDLFARSVSANLTAHYRLIYAALPYLRKVSAEHAPSITLTSSINALASYGLPAYSAAKAGLHGLSAALVDLLGPWKIRINVVAPGTVRTPRTKREWGHVPGHFERLEQTTALGRLTMPEQLADTMLALATMMTATTGQVLVADSGQMLHR